MSRWKRAVFVTYEGDEDTGMRAALQRLLRSAGMQAEAFASETDFRNCQHHQSCDCLLLRLWIPDPRCADETEGEPDIGDTSPFEQTASPKMVQ